MRHNHIMRSMLLIGLIVASPAIAMAQDLVTNVNNTPATGSPFAYEMATTGVVESGIPNNVGRSAAPEGGPQEVEIPNTLARNVGRVTDPVGNSASARGGPGTGERLG